METGGQIRREILDKAREIEKQLEDLAIKLEKDNDVTGIGIREILSTVQKRFDEIFLRR